MRKTVSAIVILASAVQSVAATLLYNQPHDGTGALSQSSWYNPNNSGAGSDYDMYQWDNFTLGATASITQLDWRGGFIYGGSWGGPVTSFTVAFYPSIGGGSQPNVVGAPLASYTINGNANQTSAGTFGSVAMYDYSYHLSSPFTASAGTKYWVEIYASHNGAVPEWGWASGSGGNGGHFRFVHGANMYQAVSGDLAFSLSGVSGVGGGTNFTKANANNDTLNVASAWVGGSMPSTIDTAIFDSTLAGSSVSTSIGGDVQLAGLKVSNPLSKTGTNGYTISPTMSGANYAGTLTLGMNGIDLSSATAPTGVSGNFFTIAAPVKLLIDQTWNVANTIAARDLVIAGDTSGLSNHTLDLNGSYLTKSGSGQLFVGYQTAVSNGSIFLNAGSLRIGNAIDGTASSSLNTSVDGTVNIAAKSGTTLYVTQCAGTGVTTWAANLTLNGATLNVNANQVGSLDIGGTIVAGTGTTSTIAYPNTNTTTGAVFPTISANISGSGELDFDLSTTTAARQNDRVTLSGDNSAFTGNVLMNTGSGNRTLRLGSSTAGSASATWTINTGTTLEVDGFDVQLGALNGAGTVRAAAGNGAVSTIQVESGSFTGAVTESAGATLGVNKVNGGVFTLSGTSNYSGPTNATGGIFYLNGNYAPAVPGNAVLNVYSLGAVIINGNATFNAVNATYLDMYSPATLKILPTATPGPASIASIISHPGLGAGSTIDITNNALVLGGGMRSTIESRIISGQNGVDASGFTNWNGNGIISSAARSENLSRMLNLFGVGVIRNGDMDATFGLTSMYSNWYGQYVTYDSLLVKYTYLGDANLDGSITISDYVSIDSTYGGTAPINGWISGDFDYDGAITISDYVMIDTAYAFQTGQLSQNLLNARLAMFGPQYVAQLQEVVAGFSQVPEPATAGLLVGAASVALISRRRRRV